MLNYLFKNIDIYKKGLQGSSLRNKIISNNIANVDTPEYKSKDINFENIFKNYLNKKTLKNDASEYLNNAKFNIRETANLNVKSNGNNVDMEKEMTLLAKNSMLYNVMVDSLNHRLNLLKSAINGGKR